MKLHIIKTREDMVSLYEYHNSVILGRKLDNVVKEAIESAVDNQINIIPKGKVGILKETNNGKLHFPVEYVPESDIEKLIG